MSESSCSPYLEERFSVRLEKICEGVLKTMFMGVSMFCNDIAIQYSLNYNTFHYNTPTKIISRCNKII